ncbi:hypothetical protein [Alkaliphilus hydrothermalis]|uniref:ABC-2 family transporter protein n=1 Tax=Alkaliphilus hydrothermalis TaxID=1482730 RepID=A0ABS2NTI1_9FIRM|nr:hypothetical protein [Alkaliphilus hydrothermalis]MBM7616243.1 hypothetical protein [Alkaliphilus hydrothermalis]
MNNILKVTKYQLMDFKKAVIIYYLVILALGLIVLMAAPSGESSFSGATFIFIFVLGLNSFKSSFKFMQANNVSRKSYFWGNIGAIVAVSIFMSFADSLLERIFTATFKYKGFYEQIYIYASGEGMLAKLSWNVALLCFATSVGFMITVLYYRASKIVKTLVSLIPAICLILFGILTRKTNGASSEAMIDFIGKVLGLEGGQNPYIAVLSFIIAAIGILTLTYGLLFRAPIKE